LRSHSRSAEVGFLSATNKEGLYKVQPVILSYIPGTKYIMALSLPSNVMLVATHIKDAVSKLTDFDVQDFDLS
jgi:hypothetical protein